MFNLKNLKIVKELKRVRIDGQIHTLVSLGYSETFARIITDKYSYDDAIMYAEEGLSKDMRAYLLMVKRFHLMN